MAASGVSPLAPNITVIHKTAEDQDDDDDTDDDLLDGSESRVLKVGRGDTLAAMLSKAGIEPMQAKAVMAAMDPVFPAQNLKPGQEVRFNLVPAPSDTDAMEPVRVERLRPRPAPISAASRAIATATTSSPIKPRSRPSPRPQYRSARRSIRASTTRP